MKEYKCVLNAKPYRNIPKDGENPSIFEKTEVWNASVNYLDTESTSMILDYLKSWLYSPIFFEVMIIDGIDAWIMCAISIFMKGK